MASRRSDVLSNTPTPLTQIDDLMATFSRRVYLLDPTLRRVGFGTAQEIGKGWRCVLDMIWWSRRTAHPPLSSCQSGERSDRRRRSAFRYLGDTNRFSHHCNLSVSFGRAVCAGDSDRRRGKRTRRASFVPPNVRSAQPCNGTRSASIHASSFSQHVRTQSRFPPWWRAKNGGKPGNSPHGNADFSLVFHRTIDGDLRRVLSWNRLPIDPRPSFLPNPRYLRRY